MKISKPELHILIAEDSPITASQIEQAIRSGLETNYLLSLSIVHTAKEAIERVSREHTYNLAILDYMLPDSNGLDIAKAIAREKPDLPVIMCTTKSQSSFKDQIPQVVKCWVMKPLNADRLCEVIDIILEDQGFPHPEVS